MCVDSGMNVAATGTDLLDDCSSLVVVSGIGVVYGITVAGFEVEVLVVGVTVAVVVIGGSSRAITVI